MIRAPRLAAVALGAVTLAFALPIQSVGCGQNAHYAATRSFATGHPYVDRYAQQTCDLVRARGHYYAAKGPALDFWSAPWYLLLHAAGAVPHDANANAKFPVAMVGVPPRAVWQIGLWAVVLPALGLLVLMRRAVERIEPGLGTAVAVTLGLATLVLPFSTLLFAHVPAAALGFLAFALLFEPGGGLLRVGAAGAAAGLAVAADLPLAVVAVAVGLYAAARAPRIRRLVAFAVGSVIGLAPLLAFDTWAFDTPFHLAYEGAAIDPGRGGVEQAHVGNLFYTLTSPHPHFAVDLLLSQRGLLVLSPVLAAGAVGIVLLWRRGLRAEAFLIGGLALVEVAWQAFRPTYALALGGWVPGPRFLIALVPFLCFALAPVLRRAPATVGGLALVSAGSMVVATSAEPLLSSDDTHHWIARIEHGNFAQTVLSLAGIGHGWEAILPFFALVLLGAATAVASLRSRPDPRAIALALTALVAWVVVEHGAPALLQVDRLAHEDYGAAAAALLLVGVVWALILAHRGDVRGAALGLPLVLFGARRFDEHTKWALVLAAIVVVALWAHDNLRLGTKAASA